MKINMKSINKQKSQKLTQIFEREKKKEKEC